MALAAYFGVSTSRAEEPRIRYEIDTDDLVHHQITVTATLPASAFPDQKRVLALPVWTPGSYKVRDYSRFLSSLTLLSPQGRIEKTGKNRWQVEGFKAGEPIIVRYQVYGHELSVRNNYFSPELNLIVGAATFVSPAPLTSRTGTRTAYTVEFPDWKGDIESPLRPGPNPTVFDYTASSYDELADSPIVFGDLDVGNFQTERGPGKVVNGGDDEFWKSTPYLSDTQKVVAATQSFWGAIPYKHYTFFNLLTNQHGGLEHHNSTVLMADRFAPQERESYLDWLESMAHEHFHAWNVKHLRPRELGPFDYEHEVYTRSLWIAEGLTSYYDMLMLRRAGVCTRAEYLQRLSDGLWTYRTTPGRKAITLADASFDAWIRLYQSTDDLQNSNISYYQKGAIVGWLLDTRIRQSTNGQKSLDDVMREAYRQFAKDGYSPEQFEALASKVCGQDLSSFFELAVHSTKELPIEEAMEYWSLKWEDKDKLVKPYLGISTKVRDGRVYVERVYRDTPAYQAGLSSDDELIAIDGNRLPDSSSLKVLDYLQAGTSPHTITLSRLGKVRVVPFEVVANPLPQKKLKFDIEQKGKSELWTSWLGPEVEPQP